MQKSPGHSQVFFSDKYNLIIGCHARCWSKSMNIWFGRLFGYEYPSSEKWYTHGNTANDPNISLWCYSDEEIKKKFKDYKVYFFTRNPYERFYSHLLAHQNYQDSSFFDATRIYNPPTMYNQYSRKILDNLNYEIVDFPNIREKLLSIKDELGIEIEFEHGPYKKEYNQIDDYINDKNVNIWDLPIKEINKIPCHCSIPNYKMVYNNEISNRVYDKYKDDFNFFNYSKDFTIRERQSN